MEEIYISVLEIQRLSLDFFFLNIYLGFEIEFWLKDEFSGYVLPNMKRKICCGITP
jgi:hypothetical protein